MMNATTTTTATTTTAALTEFRAIGEVAFAIVEMMEKQLRHDAQIFEVEPGYQAEQRAITSLLDDAAKMMSEIRRQ